MDWFDSGWGLTLAIFLPVAGMVVVLAIPKAQEQAIKTVTLVTTVATLAAGIGLLVRFDYDKGDLQFEANKSWIDVIESRYHIGIDGISLPLLLLSMVITVGCIIYSWNHFPEPHNP